MSLLKFKRERNSHFYSCIYYPLVKKCCRVSFKVFVDLSSNVTIYNSQKASASTSSSFASRAMSFYDEEFWFLISLYIFVFFTCSRLPTALVRSSAVFGRA